MDKNSEKISIFKFTSIKYVEKTEITSASCTHVSTQDVLYANIHGPYDRITTYQAYAEAITKFD